MIISGRAATQQTADRSSAIFALLMREYYRRAGDSDRERHRRLWRRLAIK